MRRNLLLLLVLSIAANIALVVAAFKTPTSPTPPVLTRACDSPEATSSETMRAGPADSATDPKDGMAPAFPWAGVASRDLAVVRDGLRAAGVPEEYVRAVVWRRIRNAHRGEFEAIARSRGEQTYWMPRDNVADQAAGAAERELDRALNEKFTEYFDEPMGSEARARQVRGRLAFLPGEKADAVTRISDDYNELRRQIQSDMQSGVVLEEDQQKLILLEKERQVDLAAVLTPEELELYELHTSRTAGSMRSQLGLLEPTEEEFRAIFDLRREYDQVFGSTFGVTSQEMMQARAEAQKLVRQQIADVLGAERYAEYERATNHGYMTAVKIADHFNLPRENADAVYAIEQECRRRAAEMRQPGTDRTQAAALVQTLAAEASAKVTALLGEEGANAFRESGGSWLRSLEQQAQRAAAAPRP